MDKIRKGYEVIIKKESIPVKCQICFSHKPEYDCLTIMGIWGYTCQKCFDKYGVGLGKGKGQKLIII